MKLFRGIVARWAAAIIGVSTACLGESAAQVKSGARHHTRRDAPVAFGPAGCVSLSQSKSGTCVLTTGCEGHDISEVEFAFDCEAARDGDIVRHSFGVGGFDANEEFDTEVKCYTCSLPSADEEILWKTTQQATTPTEKPVQKQVRDQVQNQAQEHVQQQSATALRLEKRASQHQSQVRYGPKGCISIYRSPEGNCMMQTDCSSVDIKNFEFGLVCVDNTGSQVRHLFGKDSFDAQETFDTLISCDRCLGLDDVPGDVALVGQVADLSKEVAELKGTIVNLTADVTRLEGAVFTDKPEEATKTEEATKPEETTSDVSLSVVDAGDQDDVGEPLRPQRQTRHLRATAQLAANSRDQRRHRSTHRHARRHNAQEMDNEVRNRDQSGRRYQKPRRPIAQPVELEAEEQEQQEQQEEQPGERVVAQNFEADDDGDDVGRQDTSESDGGASSDCAFGGCDGD